MKNNHDNNSVLEKLKTSINEKKYEKTIKLANEILNTNKYSHEALYFRALAEYLISISTTEDYYEDKKLLGISKYDLARKDLSQAMFLSHDIYLRAKNNKQISPLFLSLFQTNLLKRDFPHKDNREARNKLHELNNKGLSSSEKLNIVNQSLTINEYSQSSLLEKGKLHFELGNYEISLALFKKAVWVSKYFEIKIMLDIARTQVKLKKIKCAYKTLETIKLKLRKHRPSGDYFLIMASLKTIEAKFEEARKNWKESLSFRFNAVLLEEELLPLKRYELVVIINKLMLKRIAESKKDYKKLPKK